MKNLEQIIKEEIIKEIQKFDKITSYNDFDKERMKWLGQEFYKWYVEYDSELGWYKENSQEGDYINKGKIATAAADYTLTPLGEGGYKKAYQLDGNLLLKILKDSKYAKRTATSLEKEADPEIQQLGVVPKVYEYDKVDGIWAVVEKAIPLENLQSLENVFPIIKDKNFVQELIQYDSVYKNQKNILKSIFEYIQEDAPSIFLPEFSEVFEKYLSKHKDMKDLVLKYKTFSNKYNIDLFDSMKERNLGLVSRKGKQELVIIDLGM